MATVFSAPIVTSEVPILSGDVLRSIKTASVSAPSSTAAIPPSRTTSATVDATSIMNVLASRRLSAGAILAEQVGIDLNAIGRSEARKIMSVEHKVLGFRPPPGSLAAEAQAAAAKHPEVANAHLPDADKLKEAARVDAERILAERAEAEKTNGKDGVTVLPSPENGEPIVDFSNITEEEARKLMSHEHRALGFRPPPGSLAAEAQAAAAKHAEETKARKNSNDDKQSARDINGKRRRSSNDANGNGKQRRGSNDANGKQRRGPNDTNGKPRRGSNEKRSGEIRRTNSDQANGVANGSSSAAKRRASSHTNGLNATAKEELLREAAVRDAERIKATRGINGNTATENAHVDVHDLAKPNNLPGPAQANADPTAKSHSKDTKSTAFAAQKAETGPGELEHEAPTMSRSETADSVQIVGDVMA